MKTTKALLGILALALVAGCQSPTTFNGNDLSSTVKSSDLTAVNAAAAKASPLTVLSLTSSLNAGSKNQSLVITFNNGNVDSATLASAVSFWNLSATAAADGAYARDTQITSYTNTVVFDAGANTTAVTYLFDLSTAANFSSKIEVFIDPTLLTANGGAKKLNLDGDAVQGESGDDDYVNYANVAGGTKATITAASGSPKAPRTAFNLAPVFLTTAGTTTWTFTYSGATRTSPDAADATDYKAIFDAGYTTQKFSSTTNAWVNVTTTSAYSTTTGVYTVTLPAATVAGENYRVIANNSTTFVSGTKYRGYTIKGNFDQNLTSVIVTAAFSVGSLTTYDTAYVGSTAITATTSTATVSGVSYTTVGNVIITLSLTGLTAEGLTGLSTSTIKIYNTSTSTYVPVASVAQKYVSATADNIIISLDPAYTRTYTTGTATNFKVFISPDVKEGASTTATTTDDLSLGDWTNTSTLPFGWKVISSTSGTI